MPTWRNDFSFQELVTGAEERLTWAAWASTVLKLLLCSLFSACTNCNFSFRCVKTCTVVVIFLRSFNSSYSTQEENQFILKYGFFVETVFITQTRFGTGKDSHQQQQQTRTSWKSALVRNRGTLQKYYYIFRANTSYFKTTYTHIKFLSYNWLLTRIRAVNRATREMKFCDKCCLFTLFLRGKFIFVI